MLESSDPTSDTLPPQLTWTSVISLLCVSYLVVAAYTASTLAIPRDQSKSRFIFTWLLFDALTQLVASSHFLT